MTDFDKLPEHEKIRIARENKIRRMRERNINVFLHKLSQLQVRKRKPHEAGNGAG